MPVPISAAQPYGTILGVSKSRSSVATNAIINVNDDIDEDDILHHQAKKNDNGGSTIRDVTNQRSNDNDNIGCQNCTNDGIIILPETSNESLYTSRYILGLFFILLQCIVWIGGAILTQYLYNTFHFHSPFIMTYIGMSLLSLYIPIQYITIQLTKYYYNTKNNEVDQYPPDILQPSSSTCTFDIQIQNANTCSDYVYISTTGTKNYLNNTNYENNNANSDNNNENITTNYHDMNDQNNTNYDTFRNGNNNDNDTNHIQHHQQQYYIQNNVKLHKKIIKNWNHKKHIIAAIILFPSMFFADYLFNNALYHTSIASATVLVSTQCIFVFILASCICHLETYSICKMIGVLISFIGTSLTAIKDQQSDNNDIMNNNNNNPFLGDMIAVLAAILYAIYTIQVRIYCPQNEDLYSMQILLGYIGLLCFILFMPIAIYIIITNYQQFIIFNDNDNDNDTNNNEHYHMTILLLVVLFSKGFMDFLITDYCLFRSIILTNPTVATVGLGMTIPMAFLSDYIFSIGQSNNSTSTTSTAERFYSIMGAIAVTIGFLIVNLAPEKQQQQE